MSDFESFGGELHLGNKVQLFNGDSRDVLKALPDNSIDSIVTDPPYALVSIIRRFSADNAKPALSASQRRFGKEGASLSLRGGVPTADQYGRLSRGFMGQKWDTGETAFAVEFWAEVMRVLKPGGHVIAASGTRTYHRLACAIEDAGFEIRDMISWLYGSGFPKSHDVSKGIDRAMGAEREITREETRAPVTGEAISFDQRSSSERERRDEPATPQAAAWQGWGTALKPACEPWVLARKPLSGTVAANVLAHGVGALNIDGCRVGDGGGTATIKGDAPTKTVHAYGDGLGAQGGTIERIDGLGRWPANVVLSWPEDEFALSANITDEQRADVFGWLSENA